MSVGLIVGALCALGCGRIGFDAVGAPGDSSGDGPGQGNGMVTAANDRCDQAYEIDLAGGPVTFTFSTAGATSDYPTVSCCDGWPMPNRKAK